MTSMATFSKTFPGRAERGPEIALMSFIDRFSAGVL